MVLLLEHLQQPSEHDSEKQFSHPSFSYFVFFFFPTPTIKLIVIGLSDEIQDLTLDSPVVHVYGRGLRKN